MHLSIRCVREIKVIAKSISIRHAREKYNGKKTYVSSVESKFPLFSAILRSHAISCRLLQTVACVTRTSHAKASGDKSRAR